MILSDLATRLALVHRQREQDRAAGESRLSLSKPPRECREEIEDRPLSDWDLVSFGGGL